MRFILPLLMLCAAVNATAQDWIPVGHGANVHDTAFSKTFVRITADGGHNFSSLPHRLQKCTYKDTSWTVDARLPGATDARLDKSNGATILTQAFSYKNGIEPDSLLARIKASLPAGYVYSLDYDSITSAFDYTFQIDPLSKIKYIGYANYIHFTGDLEHYFILLGHSPSWLTYRHY